MAGINLLSPTGFAVARPGLAMSPNYQGRVYAVKRGYLLNIGMGDVVKTLTNADPNGGGQGYVGIANPNDVNILGIFAGIAGAITDGNLVPALYDINTQNINFGLNGSYQTSITPAVGTDIGIYVYDDFTATFKVQYSGGPISGASWRGQNITFGGNGAPNSAGRSTAFLTGLATTGTLPFRVVGSFGVVGGPQDPTATNPWLEVSMNTNEILNPVGV
jgi:hypothetical protein